MNTLQKTGQSSEQIGKYVIHYDQILGRGATATVFKGHISDSKEVVAIKVIDLSMGCDVAQRSLLENQCRALRAINHPNLLRLIDIIEDDKKFHLITKICQGVTLSQHLQHNALSQEATVYIFNKIMEAAMHLIDKNILHRDLKPANIVIDSSLNPIIIDFGFCEIIHEARVSRVFNVGSPSYMAPEAYLKTLYSEKSQSWSLAMILYEMIHKKTLDKDVPIKEFYENIRNVDNYVMSQVDGAVSAELREIMEKSFKYNPMERMSVAGMKYSIDRYIMNKRRIQNQKLIHAPSMIDFNRSNRIIKFNQQQVPLKNAYFEPSSPLKRREVSIKFIPAPSSKQYISINDAPKQQLIPKLQTTSHVNGSNANVDYFSSKIKKGVFDLKRFSKTERSILAPHSNAANTEHFKTQHKLTIKQM